MEKRRRGRPTGRTPKKTATLLDALAQGLSITHACELAGIKNRSTVRGWRKSDKAFAAEMDLAIEAGTDRMEDEIRRRAYEGVEEPVFQQGKQVGTVRRYSDNLMMFMMKKRRPEYRENFKIEHTGKDGGPIQTENLNPRDLLIQKLAGMSQRTVTPPAQPEAPAPVTEPPPAEETTVH